MDKSLVSAIIPVYNGQRYLAEAIESILKQDYHPLEIIIIDDGSTDSTAKIAQSYPEVRYIYQSNQGHGMAKNMGISAAQGEFIAFLDADDIWTYNKLSMQVNYLIQHPDIGYSLCRMSAFLEAGSEWPSWLKKDQIGADVPAYLPSALVVRKTVFEKIGNFDPTYRHANDSDWFFRAKDAGILMAMIPEVLLQRRVHDSNLSYETEAMMSERMRLLKSSIDRKRQGEFVK